MLLNKKLPRFFVLTKDSGSGILFTNFCFSLVFQDWVLLFEGYLL